jgi:hypothetical protein
MDDRPHAPSTALSAPASSVEHDARHADAWILGVQLLPAERDEIHGALRTHGAIASTLESFAELSADVLSTSGILAILMLDGWCLWSRITKGAPHEAGDRDRSQFIAACRENARNCGKLTCAVVRVTDGSAAHQQARNFLSQLVTALEGAESHTGGLTGQAADEQFHEALRNSIQFVVPIDVEDILRRMLQEAARVERELSPPIAQAKEEIPLLSAIYGVPTTAAQAQQLSAGTAPFAMGEAVVPTRETPAPQVTPTIVAHPGGWYSIDGHQKRQLTVRESEFVESFIGCEVMDTKSIRQACGDKRPNEVVSQILTKYPEFELAIEPPGKKGFGYRVRVRKATSVESP